MTNKRDLGDKEACIPDESEKKVEHGGIIDDLKPLKRKRVKTAEFFSTIIAIIATAVGIFALGVTISNYRESAVTERKIGDLKSERMRLEIQDTNAKIRALEKEIKELELIKKEISKLLDLPDSTKEIAKLKGIEIEVDKVRAEVDKLNSVILDNPEKALSVVMMRDELKDLNLAIDGKFVRLREDVRGVNDVYKWIIGMVFVTLVGLFSLAIGNLFKFGRGDKD